ncbi:MAG: hypothetical protein M0R51_12600 [Clostridia bacterium]|jgi:hypothetical protein|nr:hypothetical protein [Clostridia bacterium]
MKNHLFTLSKFSADGVINDKLKTNSIINHLIDLFKSDFFVVISFKDIKAIDNETLSAINNLAHENKHKFMYMYVKELENKHLLNYSISK